MDFGVNEDNTPLIENGQITLTRAQVSEGEERFVFHLAARQLHFGEVTLNNAECHFEIQQINYEDGSTAITISNLSFLANSAQRASGVIPGKISIIQQDPFSFSWKDEGENTRVAVKNLNLKIGLDSFGKVPEEMKTFIPSNAEHLFVAGYLRGKNIDMILPPEINGASFKGKLELRGNVGWADKNHQQIRPAIYSNASWSCQDMTHLDWDAGLAYANCSIDTTPNLAALLPFSSRPSLPTKETKQSKPLTFYGVDGRTLRPHEIHNVITYGIQFLTLDALEKMSSEYIRKQCERDDDCRKKMSERESK